MENDTLQAPVEATPKDDPFAKYGGKEVKATVSEDPFAKYGGSEIKKKADTDSWPNGSNPFLPSKKPIEYSMVKDPALKQQFQQHDEQVRQQQQIQQDKVNKGLNDYWKQLSPQDQQNLSNATKQSVAYHANDVLRAPTKQEIDDYNFSQTPTGKLVNGVKYLAQKATKGGLQVVKGAAYLATLGANAQKGIISGYDPAIDAGFDKADKATDFLSKGDQSRVEDNKTMANLGGLAEFLPSAIAGESTGGATFYLQGMGQGKEQMDAAEKSGAKINPIVKNAYILGTGAVFGTLMKGLGGDMFKSLGSSLKDDVVSNITTQAIKDAAGKEITAQGFKDLLQKGAKDWTDKALQGGTNFLKHTQKAITDLSALNVGNFALKQGVDATTDKPVFNENLGDLANQEGETLKAAPLFGAVGSMGDFSKLTPFSSYKNAIVDGLMKDSSDENIAKTKQFVQQHGEQQGWTADQIQATNDHVDEIAKITKSLPKNIPDSKVEKAVDLVQGRNDLQKQLSDVQVKRETVDPALKDIISPEEQLLTDKIDQANDKLRDIATGKKTTYSKERDDKGVETGKFLKTVDGKSEEISPSRYDLERTERDANVKLNEQTEPNTEVPAKQPADETVGLPKVTDQNDETTKNNIEYYRGEVGGSITPGKGERIDNSNIHQVFDQVLYDNLNHKDTPETGVWSKDAVLKELKRRGLPETEPITKNNPITTNPKQDESTNEKVDAKESGTQKTSGQKEAQLPAKEEVVKSDGDKTPSETIDPSKQNDELKNKIKEIPLPKFDTIKAPDKISLRNIKATIDAFDAGDNPDMSQSDRDKLGDYYDKVSKIISNHEKEPANDKPVGKDDNQAGKEPQGNPKISEQAKALADKIRSLKSDKNKVYGGLHGVATAVYDGALETAATVIEQGGKLVDAIDAAIKHIKANSDEKDEDKIRSAITKDLSNAGIEDGKPSDEKVIGVKKALDDELRNEMGLKPLDLPKTLSKQEGLERGKEIVDSGEANPIEIMNRAMDNADDPNKVAFSADDEFAMNYYERQLAAQKKDLNKLIVDIQDLIEKEPDNQYHKNDLASVTQRLLNTYDAEERRINASQIMGNSSSKSFSARKIETNERGMLINSIDRIKTIYGADMPADVKKELTDLQQKYENMVAKNEKLEADIKNNVADTKVKQAKSRTIFGTKKLSDSEFTKAKKDILGDLERDWKKSFTNTYSTLPGLPQFNALAPHIPKLVKLYADKGISKLDDVISNIHDDVKDKLEGITKDDIRDLISGKYSDKKPLTELQKKVNDLRTQARNMAKIAELEKGIIAKTKAKGDGSPAVKALQKEVADLKKKVLNEYADMSAEQLKKESDAIQKQIDKGDYLKTPLVKRTWETNPTWLKNNKEKSDLMFQLRKLEKDALDSKKSKYMRGLDLGNRWGRRIIFFGANSVYTHLSSSVVLGSGLHRLPEFAVGKSLNKMFPLLARNAPIEGYLNAESEAAFYGRLLNGKQSLKNSWSIIKTGETDLSKELSTRKHENHIPGIDLLAADGHIIIKDPDREATYYASMAAHSRFYSNMGLDATDPMLLESMKQASWKRAEYEIFQNSPKKANLIKNYFNQLEQRGIKNQLSNSKYDRVKGNAQYTAASIYNFFIPINTVPNNMVGRSMMAFRLPDKLWKAFEANGDLKKGIDKMTNAEKDLLLLHLKKGAIGAFYWTAGAILAGQAAGGLYTKFYSDKDREKAENGGGLDPKSNYLSIFGGEIGKDWQHNYQSQALQQGATWGIVKNHFMEDKGATFTDAMLKAAYATAGATADQIPTIKMASSAKEAITTPYGEEKFIKDFKRRVGVKKVQDVVKLMGYNVDEDDK